MPQPSFRHSPPPWWPSGEPWPPRRPYGRQVRRFFFWRVAGIFAFLAVLMLGMCTLAYWLTLIFYERLNLPLGALPVVLLASFVIGLAFVGRAFRRAALPVGELIDAAGRVEAGDYSARVKEHGPREVRYLARAFNAMAERLQRNERQRRDLLADVTHELRTPLTVVQGNLEALLDKVYPRDDEHVAPILEETRVLSRLVEDLSTLSLAESGGLKLHKEPTDLAILIEETAASLQARAGAVGVALAVKAADDLPLIEIDPVRIREVLTNLVANALRHTPRGGRVEVGASSSGEAVSVYVRDTGAGISPEDLPHIFDRFHRSDASPGMGLGLAIARNLVAAHGGEIAAESRPAVGTTIRFTLPVSDL